MNKPNSIEELAKKLTEFMPGSVQNIQEDIESNIRSGLESGLRKMNLVGREEFDIQNAVLLRTREKLEALEKTVAQLESQLLKNTENLENK